MNRETAIKEAKKMFPISEEDIRNADKEWIDAQNAQRIGAIAMYDLLTSLPPLTRQEIEKEAERRHPDNENDIKPTRITMSVCRKQFKNGAEWALSRPSGDGCEKELHDLKEKIRWINDYLDDSEQNADFDEEDVTEIQEGIQIATGAFIFRIREILSKHFSPPKIISPQKAKENGKNRN